MHLPNLCPLKQYGVSPSTHTEVTFRNPYGELDSSPTYPRGCSQYANGYCVSHRRIAYMCAMTEMVTRFTAYKPFRTLCPYRKIKVSDLKEV